MPSENALDRLSRVIDLIPYLYQREMPLSELAEELDRSISDLERDLEIAFLCGLPGYTPDLLIDLSMEEGCVAVTNPQSLDVARRLSFEEMTSLRLGLELLEMQYPGASTLRKTFQSLRAKLGNSNVFPHQTSIDLQENENIAVMEAALLSPSRISFSYLDTVGKSTHDRTLSPYRFVWRGGRLLLRGFDHDRGDIREFFVSQMTQTRLVGGAVVTDEVAVRPEQDITYAKAEIRLRSVPMWWKRRNSAFIVDVQTSATYSTVALRFWSEEWLIRALVPILDLVDKVDADGLSDERLRSLFLSHFSASDTPL